MSYSRAQMRVYWKGWECNPARMVLAAFPGATKVWRLLVANSTLPAWTMFAVPMVEHGVLMRETAGGTYNCRPPSLHANGLAIDINPSENPQGGHKHNFPQAFLDDVAAIKTNNGKQVFRWGDVFEIPDPMHFEINVTNKDLATGLQGASMSWKSKDGYTYDDSDWGDHATGIKWVINTGLMVGARVVATMKGDFFATRPISRREFATVALRLATDASIKDEIDD